MGSLQRNRLLYCLQTLWPSYETQPRLVRRSRWNLGLCRQPRLQALQFNEAKKAVYRPKSSEYSPLLSADRSQLLTEKRQIFKRWDEHFNNVLNHPASANVTYLKLNQIESKTIFPVKKKSGKLLSNSPVAKHQDQTPSLQKYTSLVALP